MPNDLREGTECVQPDGQTVALDLLRNLQMLNWVRYRRRKSAETLTSLLDAFAAWPKRERERFARVISDWLVEELIGCGHEGLDEYEAWLKHRTAATNARRDPEFRQFLEVAKGTPAAPMD